MAKRKDSGVTPLLIAVVVIMTLFSSFNSAVHYVRATFSGHHNRSDETVDTFDNGRIDECEMRTCVNATQNISIYNDSEDRAGQISAISEESTNDQISGAENAAMGEVCSNIGSDFYCNGHIGYIFMVEQYDSNLTSREKLMNRIGPKWAHIFHLSHLRTRHCALLIIDTEYPNDDSTKNDPFGNEIIDKKCYRF